MWYAPESSRDAMSTPGRVPIHLLDSSLKSVSAGSIPASKKSYTESMESPSGR